MLVLSLLLYVALASSVAALLFFPNVRHWAADRLQAVINRANGLTQRSVRQTQSIATDITQGGKFVSQKLRHNGKALALTATVIVTGPILALALSGMLQLPGFEQNRILPVDPRVQALLQGEQLTPPPNLPPEMFTTQEVEQVRPMIRYASRQWDLLDNNFRQRLLVVFKLMQEKYGYQMVLLEGYRSPERQNQLASMGGSVTHAGAFASYHQYGLAADCAFLQNGKIIISERDPWAARGYDLYGQVAASVGLTWGGTWKSIKDLGHVELHVPGGLKSLKPISPDR